MRAFGLLLVLGLVMAVGVSLVGVGSVEVKSPVRTPESSLPSVKDLLQNHGHQHATATPEIPGLIPGGAHQVVRVGEAGLYEAVAGQVVVRVKADGAAGLRQVSEVASRHGLDVVMTNLPGFFLLRDNDRKDLATTIEALKNETIFSSIEPDYVALVAGNGCCHSPFHTAADGDLTDHNATAFAAMRVAEACEHGAGASTVCVAVLDTGVDLDHPDLHASLDAGYDFVNSDSDPDDDTGHGTAMAGLVAADGANGQGITGVAQGVRILPVKVADSHGRASLSDVAQGIQYAIGRGARVILLSLGARQGSDALAAAVENAIGNGAVIVASAGNENVHDTLYPAAYSGVLSVVGSSKDGNGLALSTALGRKSDVAAPAEGLLSCCPNGWYREVSGTSASAALVAGAAALVASRNPNLGGGAIAGLLRRSRREIPLVESHGAWFDFGTLDLADAVARAVSGQADPAVARVSCVPREPLPGQAAHLEIVVENRGASAADVLLSTGGAMMGAGDAQSLTLAAGERQTVVVPVDGPGSYAVSLSSSSNLETTNDAATIEVKSAQKVFAQFEVLDVRASQAAGSVTFDVFVRNVGNAAGTVSFAATVEGDALGGHSLTLGAGEAGVAQFAWGVPQTVPEGILTFTADGGVVAAIHQFIVARTPNQAVTQYQQSGDIDLDGDAPFRVDPNKPYVPVMVFVADKGSS
ncbi:MAG: S8 family serine peptidase, partial [Planctomycetota bacterium]